MAVAPFREIERSYFDLRWHLDPVGATQAGVKTYDDRYGRFSPSALAPHLAALKSIASTLEETTADEREDEIDRTALLNEIRVTLRRFERERPHARKPGAWLSQLSGGMHKLMGRSDRRAEERGVSLAGRLEDVPRLLDDARAALVEPVRVFVETALRVNQGGLSLVREVAAGLGERVAAAADAAAAAMAAFAHDLERWLEGASDQFALGEDDFNFHLHYEHALRDTAPELWRYGLHLKEEIEADLGARAARLDKGKSWHDVADRLRADHPPASALVDAYAGEMARARDFVGTRGLASIPDAPLDVVPTPAFMRPVIPFAAYDSPGAYSRDRTGWFYVTLPDPALPPSAQERILRDHCRYEVGVTALHEGYPGHHLQLLHAQQQPSDTRKIVWTALTVEGWALYCEDMMGEEGFYRSEEEQFFQRVHLLWRAARVLLDVGLHTRGMTFEQGVEYLTTHLRVDRANAEAEVRRYCAESAAAFVKLGAGRLADRVPLRGPMIVLGYFIAVVVRPVIAVTGAAWQVIGLRVVDRLGKGLRTPPRDALIADVTPAELRGRAFGLQRGMDHAGAVLGPILAWWLLASGSANVRTVIGASVAPGVLVLLLAIWAARDGGGRGRTGEAAPYTNQPPPTSRNLPQPSRTFPLLAISSFYLLRMPDTLIILRSQELGVPVAIVPLLWAAVHVVRSSSSFLGGAASDRLGPGRTMWAGWLVDAGLRAGTAAPA